MDGLPPELIHKILFLTNKRTILKCLEISDTYKVFTESEMQLFIDKEYSIHNIIKNGNINKMKLWLKLNNYSYKKDKFKIFAEACKYGDIHMINAIIECSKNKIDIHKQHEEPFVKACQNGHIELAKWLIEYAMFIDSPINIHSKKEASFRESCKNGHIEVAKWLTELDKIDIHYDYEDAFTNLCINGDLPSVKWLVEYANSIESPIEYIDSLLFQRISSVGNLEIAKWLINYSESIGSYIDIHYEHDYAFKKSYKNNHREFTLWLLEYSVMEESIIDISSAKYKIFQLSALREDIEFLQILINYAEKHRFKGYKEFLGHDIVKLCCKYNKLQTIKFIFDLGIDHTTYENTFLESCCYYQFDLAKWLVQFIDIKYQDYICDYDYIKVNIFDIAFIKCCSGGNIEFNQWLIDYSIAVGNPIDIHIANDLAIRKACSSKNINFIKWLMEYAESINAPYKNIQEYFTICCCCGYVPAAQYMYNRSILTDVIIDNKIIKCCVDGYYVTMLKWINSIYKIDTTIFNDKDLAKFNIMLQ